jgi:hypothetical protein
LNTSEERRILGAATLGEQQSEKRGVDRVRLIEVVQGHAR